MNNKILIFSLLILFPVFAMYSCDEKKQETQINHADTLSDKMLIERGNYLVTIMGCGDCHSPKNIGLKGPEIDTSLILSGYPSGRPLPDFPVKEAQKGLVITNSDATAVIGAWGTSFAANITSDTTGIGVWKEEQFKNALKHGKYKGLDGARMLMPPMPWQDFTSMKDEDVKAIFYYLKSTKPVNNVVPEYIPLTVQKN